MATAGILEEADTRDKNSEAQVLEVIIKFIHERTGYSGKPYTTTCPTDREWARLSTGNTPVLPTFGSLALYFGYRRTYLGESLTRLAFGLAQQEIVKRQA